MKPLLVEIITYAPTQYYQCRSCEFIMDQAEIAGVKSFHTDTLETSMPAELLAEYRSLAAWLLRAARHYQGRVVFKVVDAASVEGIYKAVRYRVRALPAILLAGKARPLGLDFQQAEVWIEQTLACAVGG